VSDQRKTVTVVFADLVESSSTAEELDPEVWAGTLRRYYASLRSIVEKHGGTVEKFIGDAVVGVFGVPTLHEDDALRAVRAALEMPAALVTLNARLLIRVGVNTGQVIATAENALGHAISMAARLEQSAATGEVLIGKQTHALVHDLVDAEAVESLTVKGSTEPLAAWRVSGLRARVQGGTRAGTGYVGRERELGAVASAIQRAIDDRACVMVTVSAPPGVGKSRFLAEATRAIAADARLVGGRCLPYGEAITYAPLIEAIRQLEAEDGKDVLDWATAEQPDGQQVLATVRATVSGAARGSPDETAWAFRRLFDALAASKPLVITLDDLHWADALLLDLVEYVATFSSGWPIVLLCAARPELYEARPGWAGVGTSPVQIRLAPLSAQETDTLLAGLNADRLDPETRAQIVKASGGVPLFAEQMAALDAEVPGRVEVPPTIRALLAARVDRLNTDERGILELGAVEGEIFHRETVAALVGEEARQGLGSRVMALVRREFIQPESASNGRDAFAFNHALIRDAVYEQMPRRRRAELHERFAALLESRPDAADEIVGRHLEQAYQERVLLGETDESAVALARRAGLALAAAGRTATARKETGKAVDLLSRARELLSADPATRVTVLPDLIDAYVAAGDLDAADGAHQEALELAREYGDEYSELRAEIAWCTTWPMRDAVGWQQSAFAIVDRAIEFFGAIGDDSSLAQSLMLKSIGLAPYDQHKAIETAQLAQVYASRTTDERVQVEVWDELGGTMLFGPTPYSEITDFLRREIDWARDRGIPFSVADGRLGQAYALAAHNEPDAALRQIDELATFFSQLPAPVSQYGECYTISGRIERDRDNPAKAVEHYRHAMELFDQSRHRRWWRNAAAGAAHALLDMDRPDDAREVLDLIAYRSEEHDGSPGAARLEAEARYHARTGDAAQGIKLARRAVAAVADTGALYAEAHARETLAAILAANGDPAEARTEFERARSLYAEKEFLPGIDRIDAVMASA
jgi:class 3 adenylate cyclase/tetratricopeptide (TPR) repeat protein